MNRHTAEITTKISKVFFDGEFSHWEGDVLFNGEEIGGGTSPHYYGISDMLADIASDYINDRSWFKDDANFDHVELEHSYVELAVHKARKCKGQVCSIHNRSDHHMRSFKQHWRGDRRIMERICSHGVGHPDPDEYRILNGEDNGAHGCDGCCAR